MFLSQLSGIFHRTNALLRTRLRDSEGPYSLEHSPSCSLPPGCSPRALSGSQFLFCSVWWVVLGFPLLTLQPTDSLGNKSGNYCRVHLFLLYCGNQWSYIFFTLGGSVNLLCDYGQNKANTLLCTGQEHKSIVHFYMGAVGGVWGGRHKKQKK